MYKEKLSGLAHKALRQHGTTVSECYVLFRHLISYDIVLIFGITNSFQRLKPFLLLCCQVLLLL